MLPCGSRRRRRNSHLDLPILCFSACLAEDRAPPYATRPSATARPRQASPTRQSYVSPPKKRAPMPNLARGGRGKPRSRGRTALSPGSVRIRENRGVHNIFKSLPIRGRPYTGFPKQISRLRYSNYFEEKISRANFKTCFSTLKSILRSTFLF